MRRVNIAILSLFVLIILALVGCNGGGGGNGEPESPTNSAPTITNLPATVSGLCDNPSSHDVNATDPNLSSGQSLTYSTSNNTCSFTPAVNASNGMVSWICGSSPEDCSVKVTVTDDGSPPLSDAEILTIECTQNSVPQITSIAPASVEEDVLYSYDITCTDADGNDLTLASGGGDTCNGILVDNGNGTGNYSFTPDETQGGTACNVQISCTDTLDTDIQTTGVDILEVNQAPYWTSVPSNVVITLSGSYNQANGQAADDDLPNGTSGDPGYLTCSNAADNCSFVVTVSDAGSGAVSCNMSFTAGVSPETCSVDVQVSDSPGTTITENITITVRAPSVIYVDDSATGANDGTSWADAFKIIRDAVDAALAGDMIWVAEGTYTAGDPVLAMKNGVDIYGGFVGTENSLGERGNPADYATILRVGTNVVHGSSNARLDGFTIANGYTDLSWWPGAGMHNVGVTGLEISRCIFQDNTAHSSMSMASGACGGMYNESSSLTITDCIFRNNEGGPCGGGMCNYYSDPTIINSTFHNNSAGWHFSLDHFGSGGGMYNVDSSPTLINCIFTGNTAGESGAGTMRYGGAIYNGGNSSPVIFNCSFSGNKAIDAGGAIYNSGASLTLTNCILWNDTAPSGKEIGGPATVIYSDIEGGGYATEEGNIDLDPLFVDYPDLHVPINSPCVDAGTGSGAPAGDMDGNPRPSGLGHDMGAYEYQFTPYCSILLYCPSTARETAPISCPVEYNYLECSGSLSLGVGNTCTGASVVDYGDGSGTYSAPAQGVGAGSCVAEVQLAADGVSTSETILIVPGVIWYVDKGATGANDGTSWTDAFTKVQDAVDAALAGDEIWVAEGYYYPAGSDPVIQMKDGVDIYGGFMGTESSLGERGNPADHPTILDGQDDLYHVVIGATDARLDGFKIEDGDADGNIGNDNYGAGMLNDGVNNLLVDNCIFDNNNAGCPYDYFPYYNTRILGYGAGMANLNNSTVTISNTIFSDNFALGDGAGMLNSSNSSVTLTDCTFTDNEAMYYYFSLKGGGHGGAIENAGDTVIGNCIFNGNDASGAGMLGSVGSGGAINNSAGYLFVSDSEFRGNGGLGTLWGGAISNWSDLTVANSKFFGNYGQMYGGAIFTNSTSAEITNSLFVNNDANEGGAIYNSSSLTITNCTLTGNDASRGGGIYNDSSGLTISNSILWDDNASNGPEIYDTGAVAIVNYSDVQGGWTGTGNINVNPLFVNAPVFWDITTASGTTTTIEVASATPEYVVDDVIEIENDGVARTVSAASGTTVTFAPALSDPSITGMLVEIWGPGASNLDEDFHLQSGSQCIDNGTATGAPSDDLDGNPRPSPPGGDFDMGAYEYQWP